MICHLNQKINIMHGKSATVNIFHFDFNRKMKVVCFWITNSFNYTFCCVVLHWWVKAGIWFNVLILHNISWFSYTSVTHTIRSVYSRGSISAPHVFELKGFSMWASFKAVRNRNLNMRRRIISLLEGSFQLCFNFFDMHLRVNCHTIPAKLYRSWHLRISYPGCLYVLHHPFQIISLCCWCFSDLFSRSEISLKDTDY